MSYCKKCNRYQHMLRIKERKLSDTVSEVTYKCDECSNEQILITKPLKIFKHKVDRRFFDV